MSKINLKNVLFGVGLTALWLPGVDANAVSLDGATDVRASFTLGDVDSRSYDGTGFDAFAPFVGFTSGDILSFSSFTGQPAGSNLEVFLLSEVAAFSGSIPGFANTFGVLDSEGNFISLLDPSANPGDSGAIVQGAGDLFTFALNSPEGLFSTVDSDNPDGQAHILGMQVTQAGSVKISPANLFGASITFDLQVGDYILFLEDLLAQNNNFINGRPSDFDFNDMVVVVRQSEIPEPATMFLLGSGLLAGARLRRRKIAAV